MYRKVIHVNFFSVIFAGPWFVEMQPGLLSLNDLFSGAHIGRGYYIYVTGQN